MIEKDSELYKAIQNSILAVFNGEIEFDDPYDATKLIVERINDLTAE